MSMVSNVLPYVAVNKESGFNHKKSYLKPVHEQLQKEQKVDQLGWFKLCHHCRHKTWNQLGNWRADSVGELRECESSLQCGISKRFSRPIES